MKKLVRLGLLVGAIAMSTLATVKPTHAALPDCSTVRFQTCTTQGSVVYCLDYCTYKCKCEKFLGGLRWRCDEVDPSDPNYGHCA
jgi:hypothetical protein